MKKLLIITIITAIAFTIADYLNKKNGENNKSVFVTMLMFWAAGLMWSMDGVASVLEGESFFDISFEDTLLGAIIFISGLLVFIVHSLLQKRKRVN